LIASLVAVASGFVTPSRLAATQISTKLHGNTKVAPDLMPPIKNISYGEDSRQYRRTVYTHDDWRKHRRTDRFIYYLRSLTSSGIYKSLGREVTATTAVAMFLCIYNALVGGYTDFEGVQHGAVITDSLLPLLGLPMTPFTLSSPSLGLLLVFRTNSSYKRWDEARKNWGMNINHTRDLVRMGNAFYDTSNVTPEKREDDLNKLALCTWAFVRAMKRHLSPEGEDEVYFQRDVYQKLPKDQAQTLIDAAHRPNRALQDLSTAIENLPMHFMRKNQVQEAVTIFEDNLGSSERLLTSPVPLFYSRHTARFLSVWLLLLPFALYQPCAGSWNHVAMIPATTAVSIFMFGIDEIATQLEEPFTILPMQAFCDKIYNWCMEIVSWAPIENGMPVTQVAESITAAESLPTIDTVTESAASVDAVLDDAMAETSTASVSMSADSVTGASPTDSVAESTAPDAAALETVSAAVTLLTDEVAESITTDEVPLDEMAEIGTTAVAGMAPKDEMAESTITTAAAAGAATMEAVAESVLAPMDAVMESTTTDRGTESTTSTAVAPTDTETESSTSAALATAVAEMLEDSTSAAVDETEITASDAEAPIGAGMESTSTAAGPTDTTQLEAQPPQPVATTTSADAGVSGSDDKTERKGSRPNIINLVPDTPLRWK